MSVHDPAIWGRSGDLYGQGYVAASGLALRQSGSRLVDVRRPTTIEGWASCDWTLYATAEYRDGREPLGDAEPDCSHVIGKVHIGNGGNQRVEDFRFPAVGKTLHIVADSVRLDVELDRVQSAGEYWHVAAGIAIGNLLPGMTRRFVALAEGQNGGYPVASPLIEIPNFAECMRFRAMNLGAVEYNFRFQGPSTGTYFPANRPGNDHADWLFLPLNAAWLQLLSTVDQTIEVAWKRPS